MTIDFMSCCMISLFIKTYSQSHPRVEHTFKHISIWNQACVVVHAHPFKDFHFHAQLHRPFVMILGETYTGNLSAFDFAECRDVVEVAMVVVFFKVRRCNT